MHVTHQLFANGYKEQQQYSSYIRVTIAHKNVKKCTLQFTNSLNHVMTTSSWTIVKQDATTAEILDRFK